MEEVFRFTFIAPPRPAPERLTLTLAIANTRVGQLLQTSDPEQPPPREAINNLVAVLERPAPDILRLILNIYHRLRAAVGNPGLDSSGAVLTTINVCTIATSFIEAPLNEWLNSVAVSNFRNSVTEQIAAGKFSSTIRGRELREWYEALLTLSVLERAVENGCVFEVTELRSLLRRVVVVDNPLAQRRLAATTPEGTRAAMSAAARLAPLLQQRVTARAALGDLSHLKSSDLTVRRMELSRSGNLRMVEVDEPVPRDENAAALTRNFVSSVARNRLSERTRSFLSASNIDLNTTPFDELQQRIEDLDRHAEMEIVAITQNPVLVGALPALPPSSGASAAMLMNFNFGIEEGPKVPTTVGLVRPVGVGRLQIAMQQLKRYEGGDLAHVENVLLRERKERTTRRLERIEDVFTQEEETTRAEERDLQTTQRSEIQKEVKNTLSESESFRIGGSISGGYGPFVQAEISTGFETSSSSESTSRNAATYAQEIMEKASLKVSERTRELRTVTTIREFEEKNLHEFNNIEGDDHISGMFQWLNRVYEAQVFDFGVRLFFDIMVPDPAAFWRQVKQFTSQPKYDITEPPPFDIEFTGITDSNYKQYAAAYGVTGISLPPPDDVVQYVSMQGDAPEGSSSIQLTDSVSIPPGYKPLNYRLRLYIDSNANDDAQFHMDALSVQVGRHFETFPPEEFNPDEFTALSGLERGYLVSGALNPLLDADHIGPVPVSVLVRGATRVHATLELRCQNQTARNEWKKATWEKLLTGYRAALSEYRSRLAELQSQEGIEITGSNPLENQRVQEDELKRAAISMVTGQYFEMFSSILQSATMEARVDFDEAEAEGRYAKFFEEAFEWERMEYTYYPYYWAPRSTWVDRLITSDPDPLFNSFLKASFAKVRVAVRPDFEQALLHFFETGVVWKGGDLPPITDQGHSDLLAEIRERRSEELHHERIEVGDPFDIVLPTTLVRLRPGNTLPSWSKNETGEWIEDPVDE
ncbi:MAG: hypothetical protein VYA55_17075 [Pseudomonadota bacterium]|nr:hypothetical protein [Pseudomonadota bacterium]